MSSSRCYCETCIVRGQRDRAWAENDALFRWRKWSDEKPDEGTLVIVVLKGAAWPNIIQASGSAFFESSLITHWRPVGTLPKEGE